MSNNPNQFLAGHTPSEFLALFADLLQGKFDKRGGAVAGAGNNIRAGADRANLIDDLLLAAGAGTFGDTTPPFTYYDSGAIAVGAIGTTAGTPVFAASVDITTAFIMLEMYAVSYYLTDTDTPVANADGLELEFFQDAGLTKRFTTHTFFRQGEDQLYNSAGNTIDARGRLMFDAGGGTRRIYFRFTNSSATVSYPIQAMRIWGRLFDITETIITEPV